MEDFLFIDFKNKDRVSFCSYKEFTLKYFKLKEQNKLNEVSRFAFSTCNLISGMSDYKLKTTLKKGQEPSSGYVLYSEDKDKRVLYYDHDSMFVTKIESALIMNKSDAEKQIKVKSNISLLTGFVEYKKIK